MRFLNFLIVSIILVLVVTFCQADPDGEANRLYVESVQLWEQYQQLPDGEALYFEERLQLLSQIDENLKSIVSDYSESSLGVQLAASGKTGVISHVEITELLEDLPQQRDEISATERAEALASLLTCQKSLRECVISSTLQIARSIEPADKRALVLAAVARAQDVAKLQGAAGDVFDAHETAKLALEATPENGWILLTVAKTQAATGDISGALQLAQSIEEAEYRSRAIAYVARVQAVAGDVSGALETIDLALEDFLDILTNFGRALTLIEVARAQEAAGDMFSALESAKQALGTAQRIDTTENYYAGLDAALYAITEWSALATILEMFE